MKKALLTKVLSFALLATLTGSAIANENTGSKNEQPQAKVSYVGATTDGVVFNVAVANPESKKVTLKITDETGEVLYLNSYKAKEVAQKFKAPKDQYSKLNFEIVVDKKAYQQTFNVQQRVIDQVVVSAE